VVVVSRYSRADDLATLSSIEDAWATQVRDLEQELAAARVRIQGLERLLDERQAEISTVTSDRDWWRGRRQA
jgi:hypothetical protein